MGMDKNRLRILFVNAWIKAKTRGKEVEYECPQVIIKEGDTHLSKLMCDQCGVKEGEIVRYEIIREIGNRTK